MTDATHDRGQQHDPAGAATTSQVVARPEPSHRCGVTRSGVWMAGDLPLYDRPGTVRACGVCGRTWVAEEPPPGLMPSVWRPESWPARKWREWRTHG